MSLLDRLVSGIERRLAVARRHSAAFDHLARAVLRYTGILGGRLAAGIAYYGFFAVFALGLVAYWVFGAILRGNEPVNAAVTHFLQQNLPFLEPQRVEASSGRVGVLGLVLLIFTGVGWVEAIRSSQRSVYGYKQQPGYIIVRQIVDLAVLIGVFVLIGISAGAVDTLQELLDRVFGDEARVSTFTAWPLAVVVNVVLAYALLVAIPRLHMSPCRLYVPVAVVALGITLLNSVGRYYVQRWERNPAYTVVAGAVGLLLYLYLFGQLLLFGAALAATSRHGRLVDLAADRSPGPESGDDDAGGPRQGPAPGPSG